MKKIRIIKRFLVGTLILLFVFAPISFSEISSREYFKVEASEDEIISGYKEWTSNREIDGSVQVEPDATLVIKNGVTVTFKEGSYLNVDGKLFVKGTKNNPVKFRRKGVDEAAFNENGEYGGYQIYIQGEADFNNADISGGGSYFNVYLKGKDIINHAYALGESPVISATDEAKLKMRNCYIHGNMGGIELNGVDGGNIRVQKTLFERNVGYNVSNSYSGDEVPDFQYNWWDSATGPEKTCFNVPNGEYCDYEKINGNINFSNWLTTKNFKDPVIIIPGILGSEKKGGQWQIDPVFHTYDNLYEEFIQNGYIPEENLFTFPYEWRNSNVANALLLEDKIVEIKNAENWPDVDIVAHSMGGLLAREYIESSYYNGDIDQLIMLGTPNNGAPEAYLKWEAGAFLASFQEIFMKYYFKHEAKEKGYDDLFYYIRDMVPSVKELLPTYGYLYDVENNENLLKYPANYPFNDFLDSLNSQVRKEKLLQVELSKIIGNVANPINSTIAGFKVIRTIMGDYWEHGYPHGFEIITSDRGLVMNKGDRTVPLESAQSKNIFADEIIELNSSHRELPTNAQKEVVKILTGVEPAGEVESNFIRDMLFISVYSPIDIQVEAPDGKKVGKNFATGEIINEIDGAYYTGFDMGTDDSKDNEFLTIPNPIDGEYKILTQGTGDGEYKIKVAKITEDPATGTASESVAEITGMAATGSREEKSLTIGDGEKWDDDNAASSSVAGSETVYAKDSGDESDNDSEKDAKKDEKNSSSVNFQEQLAEKNDIFRNISDSVLGTTAQGEILSGSDGKPDLANLSGHKEEGRKFVVVAILVVLFSVAYEIIFPAFRRRVSKKF